MAILDDIQRMQREGKTESEIMAALKLQGISAKEISQALAQSNPKEAIFSEGQAPMPGQQSAGEAMMPSITTQPTDQYAPQYAQPYPQEAAAAPAAYPEYGAGQMPAQAAYGPEYGYEQYPSQAPLSTDTLTQISEQVMAEKIGPLKKDIEKVIDLKTVLESKVEYIDERLKRMEKIIDKLQLSILQKVGDYGTNIEDIKKELIETQKSFKSLLPASSIPKPEKHTPKKSPQSKSS